METVLTNYANWKQFLSDRVKQAEKLGLSEETIAKLAYELGTFLDSKVDPQNEEQRTIKELWDAGNEQDKQTIARLMLKIVK